MARDTATATAVDASSAASPFADDLADMHAVKRAFTARIDSVSSQFTQLRRAIKRVELARLVLFVSLPTLLYHGYQQGFSALLLAALALCLGGFIALIVRHGRLQRASTHARHLIELNQAGLARLARDFSRLKACPQELLDGVDRQDFDINLYGTDSLGQLLFNQATRLGDARIVQWFANPATPSERLARQQAIAELRSLLEHRQTLSAHACAINAQGCDLARLAAWARSERGSRFSLPLRSLGHGLTALSLGCLGAIALGWLPAMGLIVCILANLSFYAVNARSLQALFDGADDSADALAGVSGWMRTCAANRYHSPLLLEIQARLFARERGPIHALGKLETILGYARLRHNATLSVFAQALLNWDFHCSFAVFRWRRMYTPLLPQWLDAMADLEALCALASLAHENPDWRFATHADVPGVVGSQVLHPLIAPERAVANEVSLQAGTAVIITGSNMSGKTTYMRTIALNLKLAQVGSVVAAQAFRFSQAQLLCALSAADSLADGVSYFMSEALRLKQLVDASKGPTPVLFLLDEVLKGTNEKERNLALVEIIQTLCAQGAMGVLTTHNIALATAPQLSDCVQQVYFEEALSEPDAPVLRFSYQLKAGVSHSTNAIKLLRWLQVLRP